jgi:hypothetical protein
MALDRLLASCPEAQKLLEYFKIKARIEKKIDTMVANVRAHTNKKLASEPLTELVLKTPEK